MSKERRNKKRPDISPDLRGVLERDGEEAEINAGRDAALEEGIIVSREDILRMVKASRSRRKKKPSK